MRKRLLALAVLALMLTARPQHTHGQGGAQPLPPVSYVCPMKEDAEVLEDKPGNCPKCRMTLIPVRIVSKWWCPTHQTNEMRDTPGKCRRDGKELVQVILSQFWNCSDKPEEHLMDPGRCADGEPRKLVFEPRAHGDHNPQHDGQFFMAADAWHHLEGTYPRAGLFRLYFYDNFTIQQPPKGFTGSVTVYQNGTTVERPLGTYPLKPSRNGASLEATIPPANAGLPLKAAAMVKFDANTKEQRFDFVFSKHSADQFENRKKPTATTAAPTTTSNAPRPASAPAQTASAVTARPATPAPAAAAPSAPAATTPAPPQAAQAPAPQAPASPSMMQPPAAPSTTQAPAAGGQAPLILDSPLNIPPGLAEALDESKLPSDTAALLETLASRAKEVETLVNEGSLAQIWLPAIGTKTVALALDTRSASLPAGQRATVQAAVKRVVAAAWQLDAYGDLGNRQKISEAYQRLASAVTDLKAAYGNQ
jgi:hypothetical protein